MATTTEPTDGGPGLLDEARAALRVERRRVGDEREAFRAFRGRVASVPSEPVRTDGGAGPVAGGGGGGPIGVAGGARAVGPSGTAESPGSGPPAGSGLVAVRDAYRETVMSVPHYEDEYDDTYERSVAEEFSPELAYALTRGSRFHAECKRSLLDATKTATEERERFADTVRSEAESVERAASRLTPIRSEVASTARREFSEDGFGTLDAYRARSEALIDDCDRIAARRQRELASHERDLAIAGDIDVPTYLYQDLSATYPVLATVGAVGDRLDELKRRIERAMAEA
ncbi:DUF7260 family protein [Halorubrum lipolyticum]|uniref:DUF7260 domain-containing protein n=1 Tax=Halorubrum lipolyticum DSM 21995 TaxID=1227482 RepID=M0NR24_9EURY|nr:hypothetical protein [Halorubrum lipolyticum]EMA59080.1 hypothetical protein C469_10636 [Halorubrum lipolyticum DSM 21995]